MQSLKDFLKGFLTKGIQLLSSHLPLIGWMLWRLLPCWPKLYVENLIYTLGSVRLKKPLHLLWSGFGLFHQKQIDSPTFFWAVLLKHLRKCISDIHNALSRNSNISATSTAICPSLIDLPKQSYVSMFQGFSWMIALQFANRLCLKASIIIHLIQFKSRRLPKLWGFSRNYVLLLKSDFVLLSCMLITPYSVYQI